MENCGVRAINREDCGERKGLQMDIGVQMLDFHDKLAELCAG